QAIGVVACAAHSESKLVLPDPAGPQTRVTGADPTRSTRRGRATNGPRRGGTRTWVTITGGYPRGVPALLLTRSIFPRRLRAPARAAQALTAAKKTENKHHST